MKKEKNLRNIGILILSIFMLAACNTQKQSGTEESEDSLGRLKSELRDVGQEIDRLAETTSNDLSSEAHKILDEFNMKIKNFEESVRETGEKIDQESRDAIEGLKLEAGHLEVKLESIADSTNNNLEELSNEFSYDFNELGKSLKNFFTDKV